MGQMVVVNTCGYRSAVQDIDAIGEAISQNSKVCDGVFGQRCKKITPCPAVLAVTGAHAYEEVVTAVNTHAPIAPSQADADFDPKIDLMDAGIKLTPSHFAYLKISEGCNHRCTFCIIPSLRGDLVSRPIDDVMREAMALKRAGVKELLVISQDTSAYGVDLKYKTAFWDVLKSKFLTSAKPSPKSGLGASALRLPYPHVDKIVHDDHARQHGRIVAVSRHSVSTRQQIGVAMKRPTAALNALPNGETQSSHCHSLYVCGRFPWRNRSRLSRTFGLA